ncbi:MAG: hypothetical protein GX237_07255, partial [Clostridiales bacterium]|nr:hypothetical protein [Clostridiales bacterium]
MFDFIEEITCKTKLYHYDGDRAICPEHHSVMSPQRVKLRHYVERYKSTSTWDFVVFACYTCNKLMIDNHKKDCIIQESKKRGIDLNIVGYSLSDGHSFNINHNPKLKGKKVNIRASSNNGTKYHIAEHVERKLDFIDVIVVSSVRYCSNKNHSFRQVLVDVDVVLKDGTVKTQSIFAGYCKQ